MEEMRSLSKKSLGEGKPSVRRTEKKLIWLISEDSKNDRKNIELMSFFKVNK